MQGYDAIIDTPFAQLGVVMRYGVLARIDFLDRRQAVGPATAAAAEVCRQIGCYCSAESVFGFSLRCSLDGTAFQQRVWHALRRIPFGAVSTYGEIAAVLGTSARAVGNACRQNPIPVVVPCHRVVASNGIGGYAGARDGRIHDIKRQLLQHELSVLKLLRARSADA